MKNRTIASLFIAAALAVTSAACATSSGASSSSSPSGAAEGEKAAAATSAAKKGTTAADFQPLAIGNRWTYRGTMLGQPVERTITILGIEDGYFVDDAGGRMKVDQDGLRDDKRYLLKSPVAVGQKWMAVLSVTSTEHYEVTSVSATVTTPKGTFENCAVVKGTNRIDADKTLVSEWTYAPGVGIVKMATSLKNGDDVIPQATIELADVRVEGM